MKKRVLAAIFAAMLLVTTVVGCTPSGGDTSSKGESSKEESSKTEGGTDAKTANELNFYAYYADAAVEQIDNTLKVLKEIYPDLNIKIEHRTDSDGAVLKTRAAVGELPDIFECSGQLTDIFQKSGDMFPLNAAFEEAKLEEKFLDGIFAPKKASDGNYYALSADAPTNYNLFYNIEVFKTLGIEPPKNFEEFKVVTTKLKDAGKIPLSLFAQQKWPGLQLYDLAIVGEGQPLGLSGLEDGKHKITEDPYKKAANKVSELVGLGLVGKGALNTNASQAFELLQTGQAGMLGNGAWFFNDATIGGYADNVGYFEYNPFVDAGNEEKYKNNKSAGSGSIGGFSVSSKGKTPEFASKVLMSYLEEHHKVCAKLGSLSVLKEEIKPDVARSESYQKFANSLDTFETTSKYEWSLNNQELIVALEDSSELLLTGTYTPDQFVTDLEGQLADILG